MGLMTGYNYRRDGKGEYERKIRRADQRDAIVAFRILRVDDEGTVVGTVDLVVRMGWPQFDVHICNFDVDQWLNTCIIDFAAHRLLTSADYHKSRFIDYVDDEIERAEKAIELALLKQTDQVRGDDSG